jgi:hypothetical protein
MKEQHFIDIFIVMYTKIWSKLAANFVTKAFLMLHIVKEKYMDPVTTESESINVKHSKTKYKISCIDMCVNNATTKSISKQLQPNMNKAQILTLMISSVFCLFVAKGVTG